MMHTRPTAVIIVAPTISPRQEVYKACFTHQLRNRFRAEVVCAAGDFQETLHDLRDGVRFSLECAAAPFKERPHLEYVAYVMPTCVDSGTGAEFSPVVMIAIRSASMREWVYSYIIDTPVPQSVLTEVEDSICTVLSERSGSRASVLEQRDRLTSEQIVADSLAYALRHGIDSALNVAMQAVANATHSN